MLPQLDGLLGLGISVSPLQRDDFKAPKLNISGSSGSEFELKVKKKLSKSSTEEFDDILMGFNKSAVEQSRALSKVGNRLTLPKQMVKTRSATV